MSKNDPHGWLKRKKERKEKIDPKPLLEVNTDRRAKPIAGQMRLNDYTDEEVLEVVFQAAGVVAHAAKLFGCDPKTLRKRLHKIPGAIDKLNDEFRAHALELAKKSLVHHLGEMDKDITKYVMSALGGHLGFCHRTQIHLLDEKKETIEISDQSVDKLKKLLLKDVTPSKITEVGDDTEGTGEQDTQQG